MTRALTVAALLLTVTTAAHAAPKPICGPRGEVYDTLVQFGMVRLGFGTQRPNEVVEIFTNADKGLWAAVVSEPRGPICIVALGRDWTVDPEGEPL